MDHIIIKDEYYLDLPENQELKPPSEETAPSSKAIFLTAARRNPTAVDLLPGVPYNQQFTNCCKGSVVAAWGQDPSAYVSQFQVSVGQAGTSNKTVKLAENFTLLGAGPSYTCSPAKVVTSTAFLTPDKRSKTQGLKHHKDVSCNLKTCL
ncbi:COBRA-like protein 4 [Ancistrocladus abbreviatus]